MSRPFILFIIAMLLVISGLSAVIIHRAGGWQALWGDTGGASSASGWFGQAPQRSGLRNIEQLSGSRFTEPPLNPYAKPGFELLPFEAFPAGEAIWGASGRDGDGNLWFGVTSEGGRRSAHLYQLFPYTGQLVDRGDVVTQLQHSGEGSAKTTQIKIHSRVVQAADGYLYFASMDEQGEQADGSAPPRWGSHLWRIKAPDYRWEHLLAVPEGLVAVSGVGRWVYALGYWGHVLYQYDTDSGDVRSVRVGSVGGHISRNLLSDASGHVYVPRLRTVDTAADDHQWRPWRPGDELVSTLVEYDQDLQVVNEAVLEHYASPRANPADNHGIVGLSYLWDGDMVFTTHSGYLYRIQPRPRRAAGVTPLGWFHPDGSRYAPSLFSIDGRRYLAGVTKGKSFEWVVHDLQRNESRAVAIPRLGLGNYLLYGSISRDDQGRFYLVGRAGRENRRSGEGRFKPIVVRVTPAVEDAGIVSGD